jgi:hypothetical protein
MEVAVGLREKRSVRSYVREHPALFLVLRGMQNAASPENFACTAHQTGLSPVIRRVAFASMVFYNNLHFALPVWGHLLNLVVSGKDLRTASGTIILCDIAAFKEDGEFLQLLLFFDCL